MMFAGVKKRVTATRTLHRLVHRGPIVLEEVNLTLVSEVMSPSAKQHHFFIALLRSFLPHSLPVVKCLCLGQRHRDHREPQTPWNKGKQCKHFFAACLFLLHPEDICSDSLCVTHFLHGYCVLQQLGENQMSRLCFIQAFRAEIKVFKLSRPPSDCLSGHHLQISPPKVDNWLLLSWHPISFCFLLHCCLVTDSSSIPDEVTLRERDLTASPLWASKFQSCMSPGGRPHESLLHTPPTVDCARIWRVQR